MDRLREIRIMASVAAFGGALGLGFLIAAVIWRRPPSLTLEECAQWRYSVDGVQVDDLRFSKGDDDDLPSVRARIRNGTSEGRAMALHVALLDGKGNLVVAACVCREGTGIVKPGEAILRVEYLPIPHDNLDHVERVQLRVTHLVLTALPAGAV